MSEQLSFYQLFAKKGYSIEIPIIQRDYAQGRQSASEVRNSFLDALFDYLQEGTPFRDLDFIYGDVNERNHFIPLDGQQRLTTLFLLHWYLAIKDGAASEFNKVLLDQGYSRFSYKTRQSSADFCSALLKNSVVLEKLSKTDIYRIVKFSSIVKDSSWYFLSWYNDPTIQSMLCMLDAIHERFQKSEGFYAKLIDLEQPVITFQFLTIEDYGLTDDLYIKMNSRGLPLTKFENFKAKFEQHLQKFADKLLYPDGIQKYFSQKIDNQWANLFWTFKNEDNKYDDQMMNFIAVLAINHYALKFSNVRGLIEKQSKLRLKFYLDRNARFISTLVDSLDLLSADPTYKQHLEGCHYYNEIEAFKNIINNNFSDAGYSERIEFFAYYSYLVKWKGDVTGLSDWMRLVVNLTENTVPYNNDTVVNSIRSINKLIPISNKILKFLRSKLKISGFNTFQLKEERIKAHLIEKDNWASEILEAEKHPYFKGQLTFALAFSDIEAYFDEHNNCNWDQTANANYFNQFKHYIHLIFSLFDNNGLNDQAKEDYRFHRAILSKGNYLLYAKSNHSFLIDKDRDVSWKRLLLGEDDIRKKKRQFIKDVLDDVNFSSDDISSLDKILVEIPDRITNWQRKFISQPKLFDYLGRFRFIRFVEETQDKIYLLSKERMSAEHKELFTYSLYLELEQLSFQPFNQFSYYPVSGDAEEPCFYLSGLKFKGNDFEMDVYYQGAESYKLIFLDRKHNPINKGFMVILESNLFEPEGSSFVLIVEEKVVKDYLEKLCVSFSEVVKQYKKPTIV